MHSVTHRFMHRLLIAAALASPLTGSAEQPDGWRGLRWGMTAAEVEAALPGETGRSDDGALEIKAFEIDGRDYRVAFGFTGAGGLRAVTLDLFTNDGEPSRHLGVAFEGLDKLLAEKYGPAVVAKDDRRPTRFGGYTASRQRSWSSATTIVRLGYSLIPHIPRKTKGRGPAFEGVTLTYSAPDSNASKL